MIRFVDSIFDELLCDALLILAADVLNPVSGLVQRIIPCREFVHCGVPLRRSACEFSGGLLEVGGARLRASIAVRELCGAAFDIGLVCLSEA